MMTKTAIAFCLRSSQSQDARYSSLVGLGITKDQPLLIKEFTTHDTSVFAPTVGVDMELVSRWHRPRTIDTIFSGQEKNWIRAQDDVHVAACTLWSAREAAFKALAPHCPGLGLRHLSIHVDDDAPPARYRVIMLDDTYRAWEPHVSISVDRDVDTTLAVAIVASQPVSPASSSRL